MKVALIGNNTEVVEGKWAFLYDTKKEAKKALKRIDKTYSENGKIDYTIISQTDIVISNNNYNSGLNAYKQ